MLNREQIDERIASFLDGDMTEAEMTAFEKELATNPELLEAMEQFQSQDALLRAAFDEPVEQPVDAKLLQRMGLAEEEPAVGIQAANDNPPFWRKWGIPAGGAIAAGLAIAFYFAGGNADMSAFDQALENTPSGQVAQLSQDAAVSPLLTFKAKDGRYCREFSEASPQGGRTGIACRDSGKWNIEASQKGEVKLADSGQIETASGADAAAFDAIYEKLGASDPLDAASEKNLLAGGWKD